MPFDDLITDPVHMGTCARHMQYFRALYATNAKKSGMAALRTAFTTFQPRPWQRDLLTILTGPVDPRKFYWYHDYIRDTGDKMYFTSGRSSKDLPTYSMVLQRSGKIKRLASS
jgi:hypothetical protein